MLSAKNNYTMLIFVDIDETICHYLSEDKSKPRDYNNAIPYPERIERINKLHAEGHTIVYWTARGSVTQINWFQLTHAQLTLWGAKFHELRMGKPAYDLFIDDKNVEAETYFSN